MENEPYIKNASVQHSYLNRKLRLHAHRQYKSVLESLIRSLTFPVLTVSPSYPALAALAYCITTPRQMRASQRR